MAEHVWSVVCKSASIDRETNVVSLLSVVEKLRLELNEVPEGDRSDRQDGYFGVEMEVFSWWVRTDFATAETAGARIGLIAPSGEELHKVEFRIDLEASTGYRSKLRVVAFPFKGAGLYWWAIEKRVVEEWQRVARIPLEVELTENTSDSAGRSSKPVSAAPSPHHPRRHGASRAPRLGAKA